MSLRTGWFALFVLLTWQLSSCQPEETSPSRTHHPGPTPGVSSTSAAGRPNIIVIMTDDENYNDMVVMPQTVNLIGTPGVTFDRFVVTYGLCCPSRSTFLTGQYSHNHGVRSNGPPDGGFDALDNTNTLPVWLQSAGYVTGEVGKYLNNYGVSDSLLIPPGWTEWYASTESKCYNYFIYKVNQNGTIVHYGSTTAEYRTDVQTSQAVDFINRRAPESGTAPFFLWVSYLAPHWGLPREPDDPSIDTPLPAPRHKGHFAGSVLPPTPSFNEADVSDKPQSVRSLPRLTTTQISELQNAYRQRLESLLSVDEGVASIVAALETAGVLSNTVIFFTSDNGWFQGEHRISFGKNKPYEPAIHLPLMIRGPGIVAGRHNAAPVANIDLAPTIAEIAGATPGRTMDGRSLSPFLSGAQTAWLIGSHPRHILIENDPNAPSNLAFWSIREGNYVYTEYKNGDRELYNLKTDSAEVKSRHNDPTLATTRNKLSAALLKLKTCVGPVACW